MNSEIHYEIYLKKNQKAGWGLLEAQASRKAALALAKKMLLAHPAGSVRVSKETFTEETSTFRSVTVFEDGAERHKRQPRSDNKMEPPCAMPEDLYNMHARRTLGRALAPWLRQNGVCAIELLHRSDLAEKLAAAGHDRQHAVQKVAILQAGAQECSVQHMVRRLTELADAATDRLRKMAKSGRLPAYDDNGFAATIDAVKAHKDPLFALRAALAARLGRMQSWPEKISFLSSCVSDALVSCANTVDGFLVLDEFVAEIVSLPDALDACIEGQELGDKTDKVAGILCGKKQEGISQSAMLLATAVGSGKLPMTQSALSARVFRDLSSPRRLFPDDTAREIELNRILASRLAALPAALAPPEQLSEAFSIRSARLLEENTINTMLSSAIDPAARIMLLIELEHSIVGKHNKSKLATYVRGLILAHKTESWVFCATTQMFARIAQMAHLQRLILKSGFTEDDKKELSSLLDLLCKRAIEQKDALTPLVRRHENVLAGVVALLRLHDQGIIPSGACADMVNQRAMIMLRGREARAALAAPGAQVDELTRLLEKIQDGGNNEQKDDARAKVA